MNVIDEIAAERKRQIEVEGWSVYHDDEHGNAELARAAAAYALTSPDMACHVVEMADQIFPWDEKHWKPKGTRRNLIRAAALLVAEIERLDRIKP